jgi:hypothetical protein
LPSARRSVIAEELSEAMMPVNNLPKT